LNSDILAGLYWTKAESQEASTADLPDKPRDIMTEPHPRPLLTPQFCFSTGALQDFLRTSRRAIDDTIIQNLNALASPSRDGFDPSSTWQRIPRAPNRLLDPSSCSNFKDNVLFPSWKARSDVLQYCESVAKSPDPQKSEEVPQEADFMKPERPPLYDRSDPYKSRHLPQETEMDRLASLVRNEQTVERIVRARSWKLVAERCGNIVSGREEIDSEIALNDWSKRTGS